MKLPITIIAKNRNQFHVILNRLQLPAGTPKPNWIVPLNANYTKLRGLNKGILVVGAGWEHNILHGYRGVWNQLIMEFDRRAETKVIFSEW